MDLDPKQREAVEHGDGPLLIVAGPGSGKTRVLVQRVAHLVRERNVPPDKILVTTFTKKAAEEMRNRLRALIEEDADALWLGTVHSRCLEVLRQKGNGPLVGLQDAFTIADDADAEKLAEQLAKAEAVRRVQNETDLSEDDIPSRDLNIAVMRSGLDAMHSRIAYAKEWNVGPDDVRTKLGWSRYAENVYRQYNQKLHASNRVDFGDMQMLTVQLLREAPNILGWIQRRFQYVLVDEYQDTNAVQAELFKLICSAHRNITVVGDVCQAVYAFRGATPQFMLSFPQDWPGAKVVYLDRNYRSSGAIVRAAQAVIDNNEGRFTDFMSTAVQPGGETPQAVEVADTDVEALVVAGEVERFVRLEKIPFREMAVLYRSHQQSRAVEQVFLRQQIPHIVLGGTPYFARKEVQDLMAWLGLLVNHKDDNSFKRAVMAPPRGVGNVTLDRLRTLDKPLLEAAAAVALDDVLASRLRILPKQRNGLREVAELCASLEWALPEPDLLARLAKETGYLDFLATQDDGPSRGENAAELCSLYAGFDELRQVNRAGEGTPKDRPIAFLDWAATELRTAREQRNRVSTDGNVVTLMSMHAAKGTEFDAVFILGCVDGVVPAYYATHRSDDGSDLLDDNGPRDEEGENGLEEERRLFYVAMTRARKHLRLMVPRKRRAKMGQWVPANPSQFLGEAEDGNGKSLVDWVEG